MTLCVSHLVQICNIAFIHWANYFIQSDLQLRYSEA